MAPTDWACAYCRQPNKRSKEHVIPEWLSPVVPGEGPVEIRHETDSGELVREWQHPRIYTLTTRAICEPCNHGWLSNLEGRAKPAVTRLVQGQPGIIAGPTHQIALAAWLAKTAYMFDLHFKDWHVPETHRRDLYDRRHPSANTFIWLYYCRPTPRQDWRTGYGQRARLTFAANSGATDGYLIAMSIGHLAFQVGGYLGPEEGDTQPRAPEYGTFRQLWPLRLLPLERPPPYGLDNKGVDALLHMEFV